MKHAKPSLSRSNSRVIVTAALALGFIAAFFGIFNASARDTETPATQQVLGRVESCKLSTASTCVINHGLGVKPTAVVTTPAYPGQNITIDVTKISETSYTVLALWHDGKKFTNQPTIKFNAVYTYVGTPVTPSPTPTVTTPTETPTSPPTTPTATPTTPTNTPTQPAGACDITKAPYQTSEAYGSWVINPADPGGVQVNNNVWGPNNPWSQTLYACSKSNWSVIANHSGSGTDDGVKSYPDTQYHVNLPVSSLTTLNSTFKVNTPSGGGQVVPNSKQWNAAYDLWLAKDGSYDSRWGIEVMVWNNWTANWQYWYNELNGEDVTIDGVTYGAYHRAATSDSAAGIWFVRKSVTNDGNVDLAKLLKWAQGKGWIASTAVLHEIEYGFEIMYTGQATRFDLLDFSVNNS